MDFKEELRKMQTQFYTNRPRNIWLKRPDWLAMRDPMSDVFKEKKMLLKHGNICYAYIVQANTILFKFFPHTDCPAHLIYSTDSCVAENLSILQENAFQLYKYKNTPIEEIPLEWQRIVGVIADEYDRSEFTFSVEYDGNTVGLRFMPTMIFRKLLPRRKLCGSLLPIITAPNCRSILVLPKRFWTKEFKTAWVEGII